MSQDLPPQGGYEPIQYRRNLPFRGFRPAVYVLAVGVTCVYGFWQAFAGIKEQRELAREKLWARVHLIPVMQAETDRDLVRRALAADIREAMIMKEVKNHKLGGVYYSDRFVAPTVDVAPTAITPHKQ